MADSSNQALMLRAIRFHGFKSLRDVELAGLQQLNVIVGPSGVGKTSVLEGLHLLTQLAVPQLGERDSTTHRVGKIWRGRWAPTRLTTSGESQLRLDCETDGDVSLSLCAISALDESDTTSRFEIRATTAEGTSRSIELPRQNEQASGFFADPLFRALGPGVLLKFDADRLGAVSLASSHPRIGCDGGGLATVLAYFAGAYRERLQSLESELRSVLGITGRIRSFPAEMEIDEREMIRIDDQLVPRVSRRQAAAHRFEVEVDGLGSVPGDLLSEGTLATLGLLAILHQPKCPRLLLIDDIDQGLHPEAQARLVTALRRLLAGRPGLQLVCTSHSPYLLDHVEPSEVQVMSWADGRVSAARLDLHEDWPRWQGKLQTGEFWQSVGEDWVVGRGHV